MHILVIDDDSSVRTFVRKALEGHGHAVSLAEDGTKGLKLLCDAPEHVDAVVLDLVMPSMDGWATFRAIRALNPAIPVVLISGFDALGVVPLLSEGFVSFLQKPFTIDDLLGAIAKSMNRSYENGPTGA